jgi:hypothetical protein
MNEGKKGYVTSAAIEGYRVLQLSGGKVLHATETPVVVLGFSEYPVASGDVANVVLLNKAGTVEVEADGAITAGAACYAADAGKVQALPTAAGSYRLLGTALVTAADGDVFEMLPTSAPTITVVEE